MNTAVTVLPLLTVTVQLVSVPVQSPFQRTKSESASGVALSVTFLPDEKPLMHVVPQLMPLGLLLTVPVPVPFFITVMEGQYPRD